jgi:hypothetical protein
MCRIGEQVLEVLYSFLSSFVLNIVTCGSSPPLQNIVQRYNSIGCMQTNYQVCYSKRCRILEVLKVNAWMVS